MYSAGVWWFAVWSKIKSHKDKMISLCSLFVTSIILVLFSWIVFYSMFCVNKNYIHPFFFLVSYSVMMHGHTGITLRVYHLQRGWWLTPYCPAEPLGHLFTRLTRTSLSPGFSVTDVPACDTFSLLIRTLIKNMHYSACLCSTMYFFMQQMIFFFHLCFFYLLLFYKKNWDMIFQSDCLMKNR